MESNIRKTNLEKPLSPASARPESRPGGGRIMPRGWIFLAAMLCLSASAFAGEAGQDAVSGKLSAMAGILKFGLIVAFFVLLKIAWVASAVLASAICPDAARRAEERVSEHPVKYFALGMVDAVAAFVILLVLVKLGELNKASALKLVTLAYLLLVMALLVLGSVGVYRGLGKRIGFSGGKNERLSEIFFGGLTFETAALVPLLGWAAQTAALLTAFGVGVALLFDRRGDAPLKQEAAPELPEETES